MRVISFGGGVQSTAMAVLAAQGKIEAHAAVFCDTGFEASSVFTFMQQHTEYQFGLASTLLFTAKAEKYASRWYGDLNLPPFFSNEDDKVGRQPAFCSSKWKRDVFTRFCNDVFGDKRYDVLMGFSTDEKHRAERMKDRGKKWHHEFPLLELGMSRQDCVDLVESVIGHKPPRSSCYYCPNKTIAEWKDTWESEDREKLIEFDKNLRSINRFLTFECLPIDQCKFVPENEINYSRLCAGGCFL